jgi:Domain of unknown function (DUF4158)
MGEFAKPGKIEQRYLRIGILSRRQASITETMAAGRPITGGFGVSLTEEDFVQLAKCRRPHNRLGFAYQVAFVRLFDRFPQQQPFELIEELVSFSAAQLGLDAGLIELYRKRQPTISEHQ